ncbi:MAG: tetratricopeptide repeat protein [Desulfuromonadales bacterium]|nr:tetratricopeptide repeat protein [Desulfuromonadales bacterium]
MAAKFDQSINWLIPVLCAVAALYALTFPLQDPDTFWHLAYGRAMVNEGRFINHEIFSYTAAGKYLDSHSQLAQVALYLLWSGGTATALLGFKLFVGLVTFLLVMRTAQLFAVARSSAAIVALLVILAGLSRFVERPELFSILLQALLLLILFGYGRGVYGVRVLWSLPVLLVTWDYLHGALFGLIILLTFMAGETVKTCLVPRFRFLAGWCADSQPLERLQRLWCWGGITLVAMFLHPNGLLNYSVFWKIASDGAEFVMYGEWMPTQFIPQFFWFWLFVGIVLFWSLFCYRRLDLTAALLVIPFLYLGLKYNRGTLALALAAVPLLAHCLSSVAKRTEVIRWRQGAILAITVVVLLAVPAYKEVYGPDIFRFGSGLNENAFPVGSTRFIADVDLPGNMFNSDGVGGYLAFFLGPQRKIFNYNQPGVFTALTDYVHKPESRSRWDIRYALVNDAKGYTMFLREGFVPVYREANAMVLLKPTAEQAAFIEKYRIRYFEPLKSVETLQALSQKPWAAVRLCEEIATYLTYRRDEKMAHLLATLLKPGHPDVQVDISQRRTWLEAARRENQENLALLQTLGIVAYHQKDLAQAEVFFDQVLSKEPDNIEVLLNRGYIDYDRKDYRKAAERFAKAVKLSPAGPEPHYALGLTAMRLGENALMQKHFEKFLQLAPNGSFADIARKYLSEGRH